MTDEQAFIEAIKASPSDDLPRKVYADWCEEHGEAERAEFIRCQVEHARTECPHPDGHPEGRLAAGDWLALLDGIDHRRRVWGELAGAAKSCPRCALLLRSLRLLRGASAKESQESGDDWLGPDWPLRRGSDAGTAGGSPAWHWVRGFVEILTCSSAAWLQSGDAITARHPVRTVRLTTWPDGRIGVTTRMLCDEYAARWPGVTFELPRMPDVPREPNGMFRSHTEEEMSRAVAAMAEAFRPVGEAVATLGRVMSEALTPAFEALAEYALVMHDDAVGVIEAEKRPSGPPRVRRRRPDFSAARWTPRFPRPR